MLKGFSGGKNIDIGDLMGKFSRGSKQSGGIADVIGKVFG
jgi:hypothetical protein